MRKSILLEIMAVFVIMILCNCVASTEENTVSESSASFIENNTNATVTKAVIQSAEQTTADGAGLLAEDVLHQTDGTEVTGKLTAFDGNTFTVDIQGEAKQIPRSELVSIALGQPHPRPKLLYVGSDADDLANNAVAEALKKAGFDLTSATRLPASLEGFDVVFLESVSASSQDAAKMLRSFVGKGGGVVLVGSVPMSLCPDGKQGWSRDQNRDVILWDTSAIADWVGAADMEFPQNAISNPRCAAAISNPFFACPDITVGQELYVFQGESKMNFFVTGSLSAQARPVAKIRFENEGTEFTHIAAFAHPFGQGRTYYQFMSYEPNHPKLLELLVAATKWTAGALPEIGG